jgi:hypothetical protein
MKKYLYLIVLAIILMFSCSDGDEQILILKYDDFGPQAIAWETLGMQWWQWDNHGDSDPNAVYDIKIVVYRDIPLRDVKERFPVVQKTKQDYRYIKYNAALRYLDKNILNHKEIETQWAKDIVKRHSKVRNKIINVLKEKN